MMSKTTRTIALLLALQLATAGAAAAAGLVLGGQFGYAAYTHDDLNEAIDASDNPNLQQLKWGWEYSARIGMATTDAVTVGVLYGRLTGETGFSDPGRSLEIDVPADMLAFYLNYLPPSDRLVRLGLGTDLGMVDAKGKLEGTAEDAEPDSEEWTGRGLLVGVYVIAALPVSEVVALTAQGGFRFAKVPDLSVNGQQTTDSLDYTGVFLRAGLRLAF